LFLICGTALISLFEPSVQNLPLSEKLLISFFQTTSASTTAGFNTVPIGQLALPTILIIYFLMFFGASPAGTGGGLKLTTLTALIAELWSHLRGYDKVCFNGKELPNYRIRAASMTFFAYMAMLGLSLFFMSLAMPEALLEKMIFEVISALSTVGLSMSFTSDMNSAAKWIIIFTMYIGRIGVVTLGMLFVSPQEADQNKSVDLAV
jgi:trk system potassium uptake protein TrkH